MSSFALRSRSTCVRLVFSRVAILFFEIFFFFMASASCQATTSLTACACASSKMPSSFRKYFLKEEGIFEEAQAQAVKEVVAWQLAEAMKKKKISKNKMATLLKTSRTQVDRLLSAKDDITLSSLQRAAAMVGRRVTIELV